MMLEDRVALEELYRWVAVSSNRSVVMVGPDVDGWVITLSEGSKRRTERSKSFAGVVGKLLGEMK